jgi:hypothetical protein
MPFNNDSDPDIIARSATVTSMYTQEKYAYIMSLIPNPASFGALSSRVSENYAGFLQGDPEKTKAFEADRKELAGELSLLLTLSKMLAGKDPTVQQSLGFEPPVEKVAPGSLPLTSPHGFKAFFDPRGRLISSSNSVPNARGYQVWACEGDPSNEANWRMVASSSRCKGIVIQGLNRAKFNLLRIRAIRATGVGPWSNWVSLDPTL